MKPMGEGLFEKRIPRRRFVKSAIGTGILMGLNLLSPDSIFSRGKKSPQHKEAVSGASPPMREAMFYSKLSHNRIQCGLCFRRCILHEGERGECRNRENRDGTLMNLVWGRPSAIQIDPVEKEPQYHFLPGTLILCFGTAGCNFHCRFCQNWHLSQRSIEEMEYFYTLGPEEAVAEAVNRRIPTISFTYNEPTSFYEYAFDIARIAKKAGIRILWHSNGAINNEPLHELLKYTDEVTIDLKGFTDMFYAKYSDGDLRKVMDTLVTIREKGVWLEIVNLVIPTANDDARDIERMCRWIVKELGKEVPLHFSRFFPAYRLTTLSPTPLETLEKCYQIARESSIHYVTVGNVPGHKRNSTYCPECGGVLIKRTHFEVLENKITNGKCPACGHVIPGVWEA
jgi:pyruvate formate lyase activating enzyme